MIILMAGLPGSGKTTLARELARHTEGCVLGKDEIRAALFSPDDIERAGSPLIRKAITRMRAGKVHITPGFDGEYGRIKIFEGAERKEIKGQTTLF